MSDRATLALEVAGLRKSYPTPEGRSVPVVDVPSFTLDRGEQCALQGESGSGKTTFLHLLGGILKADGGSIRIAGREMVGLSEAAGDRLRAGSIGYVFQSFNLLQGYTALENVLLPMAFSGHVDQPRARALLELVGLADRSSYLPSRLSVGQQQRVAVARALANKPALLLADEPTGNLDPKSTTVALQLIRSACEEVGAALLLVSHSSEVLADFERREAFESLNRAQADAAGADQMAASSP